MSVYIESLRQTNITVLKDIFTRLGIKDADYAVQESGADVNKVKLVVDVKQNESASKTSQTLTRVFAASDADVEFSPDGQKMTITADGPQATNYPRALEVMNGYLGNMLAAVKRQPV